MQSASHELYLRHLYCPVKTAQPCCCSSRCHHLSENGDENKAMCRDGIRLFLCTHTFLGMHFWAGSTPWCFKNVQELLPSWALINICPTMNLLNVIQVRWAKTSQFSDTSRNILSKKKKKSYFFPLVKACIARYSLIWKRDVSFKVTYSCCHCVQSLILQHLSTKQLFKASSF